MLQYAGSAGRSHGFSASGRRLGRSARRLARMVTQTHAPAGIRVLGALLDDMPEAALLGRVVTDTLHVAHEPSRHAVLARLRGGDFDAVVFPVVDGRGLPTAPLIHQCAVEHSRSALIAICCSPPLRANALLAAARAGACVVVSPSAPELTALLSDRPNAGAQQDVVTRRSLEGVEPRFLRDILAGATRTVGENGHVGTFAASLQVSTRTLSRQFRQAGLPSPRAVLAVARLLWACAEMESFPNGHGVASARPAAAADTRYLRRIAAQYAVPVRAGRHPHFPRFSEALGAVVRTLGGRLNG